MCLHVSSHMQISNYERYKGITLVIGPTNVNKNHTFPVTQYTQFRITQRAAAWAATLTLPFSSISTALSPSLAMKESSSYLHSSTECFQGLKSLYSETL